MQSIFRGWLSPGKPFEQTSDGFKELATPPNTHDAVSPVQLSEPPLSEFRPSIVNKLSSSSGMVFNQGNEDADEGVVPDELEIFQSARKPFYADITPMI